MIDYRGGLRMKKVLLKAESTLLPRRKSPVDACPSPRYNSYAMPRMPKIYIGTVLIVGVTIAVVVDCWVWGDCYPLGP